MRPKIRIFTTGGTIDKVYFDKKSDYEVGAPRILDVFRESNVNFEFEVESILKKDSLDMTDEDRTLIFERVNATTEPLVVITHGTDSMIRTAQRLKGIKNKTIVMTGSMWPAVFKESDAEFNIGCAVAVVQVLPPGVYLAMNGRIWNPEKTRKNLELNQFEEV